MVYSILWDETTPTDDNFGYDLDTLIQDVKKAVRERLNTEHSNIAGGSGLAYLMHQWATIAKSTGSPYTALITDHILLITTGASDYTINLPSAATCLGKPYKIKKVDSGVGKVIIDADGTETIDDGLTTELTSQYQSIDIVSDGVTNWQKVSSFGGGINIGVGHFSNLKIKNASESGASSGSLVITADSVVLKDVSNFLYEAKDVNVTLDLSSSGANGLDTGTITNTTWYFIWLICNGTTVSSLASLSSSSPTMPSGYTYKKLVGATRNIGRVVHLHMDGSDASTTFTDESGKTWTAFADAKLTTSDKKFGTASGIFDGTGDYISTPDHTDFDLQKDFTIEFWVKRNTTGTVQRILGQGDGSSTSGFVITLDGSNNLYGTLYSAGGISTTSITLTDTGSWHHVAWVRKGYLMTMFLDGVKSTPVVVGAGQPANSTTVLSVGRWGTSATEYFNGKLDEVSITINLAKYWENFTNPTAALGNLTQILPFTQIDREVQLSYPAKVGDNVGSTTTESLSLSTIIPTIVKGVHGKIMANTGALIWHYSPATFPNSIVADNNFTNEIYIPGDSFPLMWKLPILLTDQTMYHQVSANTVDIWISGFDLREI